MNILRVKRNGEWVDIPAIVGPKGDTGDTGEKGDAGPGVPDGGTQGQVLKKASGTDQDTEWAGESVTDVQVNGTSVVSNGVANVPVATPTSHGVVKVRQYTDGLYISSDSNLGVYRATSSQIKNGGEGQRPIVPYNQHESAFYGLAKAAGDATQSASSNTVGVYTEEAKIAIQKMLGIYQPPWELIKEVTTTEDVTEVLINTDSSGQSFELTDMIVIFDAPASTTGNRDSFYTSIGVIKADGSGSATLSLPSLGYVTATSVMLAKQEVHAAPDMPIYNFSVVATSDGNTRNVEGMAKSSCARSIISYLVYQSGVTKSLIPSGTNVKLYGRRKWN